MESLLIDSRRVAIWTWRCCLFLSASPMDSTIPTSSELRSVICCASLNRCISFRRHRPEAEAGTARPLRIGARADDAAGCVMHFEARRSASHQHVLAGRGSGIHHDVGKEGRPLDGGVDRRDLEPQGFYDAE